MTTALTNMYNVLSIQGFYKTQRSNSLSQWSTQGVLLMNTTMTSCAGRPLHHVKLWRPIVKKLIAHISKNTYKVAWMLWGKQAFSFANQIDSFRHMIFKAPHPQEGQFIHFQRRLNMQFKECNEYLEQWDKTPIDW